MQPYDHTFCQDFIYLLGPRRFNVSLTYSHRSVNIWNVKVFENCLVTKTGFSSTKLINFARCKLLAGSPLVADTLWKYEIHFPCKKGQSEILMKDCFHAFKHIRLKRLLCRAKLHKL